MPAQTGHRGQKTVSQKRKLGCFCLAETVSENSARNWRILKLHRGSCFFGRETLGKLELVARNVIALFVFHLFLREPQLLTSLLKVLRTLLVSLSLDGSFEVLNDIFAEECLFRLHKSWRSLFFLLAVFKLACGQGSGGIIGRWLAEDGVDDEPLGVLGSPLLKVLGDHVGVLLLSHLLLGCFTVLGLRQVQMLE